MSMLTYQVCGPVNLPRELFLHHLTSYRPDIVIYNEACNLVALLELICPLDSIHHLESARDRKQSKVEYHQISLQFDRLGVPCYYDTVELSVLGHHLQSSLSSLYNTMNFVQQPMSKSQCRKTFDEAAGLSISATAKNGHIIYCNVIFLAMPTF